MNKYYRNSINMESPNSKSNNESKLPKYTLAYFGAGWNFSLLADPTYKKFKYFVFIDALPKLMHYDNDQDGYSKCKDKETLIATLINAAKEYGFCLKSKWGNLLTFTNPYNTRVIYYYYNTTVIEALQKPSIRKKLNKAKWLHEQGFYPYQFGLKVGDLPNLVRNRSMIKMLP